MTNTLRKKIAMVGQWGAGKTSLVKQFINHEFSEKYHATLGVKTDIKNTLVDGEPLKMVLWDIAGAEDNVSIPMHYIQGAAGYLLVLDGTRKDSFERGLGLVNEIETELGELPYTVVVNKNDLEWELDTSQLDDLLAPTKTWFSTSAKTGENVEAAFDDLAKKVISS